MRWYLAEVGGVVYAPISRLRTGKLTMVGFFSAKCCVFCEKRLMCTMRYFGNFV